MEELIKQFLSVSDGDGYGSGSGSGSGSGYGYGSGYGSGDGYGSGSGYGSGYGYGSGDGDGSGYGYGSGSGDGLQSINGEAVYMVDGIQTVIRQIHGNVARAAMVNSDLSLTECYILKDGDFFAHGETIHAAAEALQAKLMEELPEEDRIARFVQQFQPGIYYPNREFFAWHHYLTGSCEAGRRQFARDHRINLDRRMTPESFIRLTRNAYGGEIIRKLAAHYPKSSK